MTGGEKPEGTGKKLRNAGLIPVVVGQDVRVAHRARPLVDRRRVLPSQRDASGPTERPRPFDSLIRCATRDAGSARHVLSALLLRLGGVRPSSASPSDTKADHMGRLRRNREAKALEFLRSRRNSCTALEIGEAAIAREERSSRMPPRALASIGRSIGLELVRRHLVKAIPGERFRF